MNRKFKENVAMIVIAHALMLTGPAIVQARGLDNPINFTKPIKSEKGAISPIGPVKDARYFERDDACEIVKAEMGWTDCKTIDLLVINPGAGIDTILLDKPVASGYVTVDDFNSAEAKDVIASIEKSLRGQATAQSEKLGKNIQFTGWRLNPTADKSKGLIYYATDWNWDGESVLSIRVLLLGRFGYTPLQIIPVESNLNSEAIATMVAKTVASYKPDPETAYSDFRQGDKVAAVGGLGVLATVLGVKYGKVAAVGAVGLLGMLKGKALLLLALPFLLLGGLFRRIKSWFRK